MTRNLMIDNSAEGNNGLTKSLQFLESEYRLEVLLIISIVHDRTPCMFPDLEFQEMHIGCKPQREHALFE